MVAVEERLVRASDAMAELRAHEVPNHLKAAELAGGGGRSLSLGEGQVEALRHVLRGEDLSLVVGYAGTGKSAMLGAAREAWEAAGYRVQGAALSGIAAESLEAGSGITSRTLASLERDWSLGRNGLSSRDVLAIDEAGMIGSRQMERVLRAAHLANAKVVLVGDAEQLQAIEAGAAFRALTERHGAAEVTEVRRQTLEWQKAATRELATGRTGEALERYEHAGAIHVAATREEARRALVEGFLAAKERSPEQSQIVLAHTRADVQALNQAVRWEMRSRNQLGEEVEIATDAGHRAFAAGDRIMFTRNDRSLGVKNGTRGRLEEISQGRLTVKLDGPEGRRVSFDNKNYNHLDHGYATTIHKAQGLTVDQAHVLLTPGLDRHATYVALSRHREGVSLHYAGEEFANQDQLARTLGRERSKDVTWDFREDFHRAKIPDELDRGTAGDVAVGTFSRFKPETLRERPEAQPPNNASEVDRAVRAFARAFADVERMHAASLPVLPHQSALLEKAREGLASLDPTKADHLEGALSRVPELARAGPIRIEKAIADEAVHLRNLEVRGARFVETWNDLRAKHKGLTAAREHEARRAIENNLKAMADGLRHDAPLAKILEPRATELGLVELRRSSPDLGLELTRSLSRDLDRSHGLER